MSKPPIGTIRLKRIERDLFDLMAHLTKVRLEPYLRAQAVRDTATRTETIASHLWQVANELDPNGEGS